MIGRGLVDRVVWKKVRGALEKMNAWVQMRFWTYHDGCDGKCKDDAISPALRFPIKTSLFAPTLDS